MEASGIEAGASNAHALADEGRLEEAIAACEQLVRSYQGSDSTNVRQWLANLMSLRCWCFGRLGDCERLLEAGAELEARYSDADDPYLRKTAVRWMWDAVWCLSGSGRFSDAIALSDRLIAHFVREGDPTALAHIGNNLFRMATRLAWGEPRPSRPVTVLILWAQAIGDTVEKASVLPIPAGSRLSGIQRLADLPLPGWNSRRERFVQAARIFEVLVDKTRGASEAELQKVFVRAALSRAVVLVVLGRVRDGWRSFDTVFEQGQEGLAAIVRATRMRDDGRYDATDLSAAVFSRVKTRDFALDEDTRRAAQNVLQEATQGRSTVDRVVAWIGQTLLPK